MIGWLAAVGLGLALLLVPHALVCVGTREATACIKSYEAARAAELPWCGDAMSWFSLPARIPWTITPATYRAEELRVRIAMGHYQNAIAGRPNRDARAKAADLVQQAHTIVRTGSQRLAFEELGPAASAPDPGQDAALAGDRDLLLLRAKDWLEWHVRLHTLRAALLEGGLPRALDVAKHYASYDPRDEDLRGAIGAVLCLGGETARGLEMFVHLQNDRAARRYAAMSRNWGDVRTAILACAALGNAPAPPRPLSSDAGQDDERAARLPVRLRLSEDAQGRLKEAQKNAQDMFSDALPAGVRAPILAALAVSGPELEPIQWADFGNPRQGEPPMLDLGSVNVLSWLDVPEGRPMVVGSVYARAAERLAAISLHAGPFYGGMVMTVAALWIEAARAYVRAGDAKTALEMLERASKGSPTEGARMDSATRALAEGIILYATGDPEGAHAAVSRPLDKDVPPDLRAATLALRAETSGVWGPPSREEATAAFEAARETQSAALIAWARRLRFWAVPGSEPPAAVSPASLDAMAGRFALWPSLGYANKTVQWGGPDDLRLGVLEKNLAVWSAARAASEDDKRPFRYALLRNRGDMPDALVPYLAVAAELRGQDGDAEVWLDAVMATDAPRFSMRAYAWARAQAARARGDRDAHALWTRRFERLAKLMGDEERAELARFLGI